MNIGAATCINLLLWCCAVDYVAPPAEAQAIDPDPSYYSFHPQSVMSLGLGFRPNNVNSPKVRCIEAATIPLEPGALNTQFQQILVTTSEQLKEALSLDSKIDASYLSFGGGANFSYSDSGMFSSDAITVVISASTEFGRLGLGPPKLTPSAKAILSDSKKFADTCGTRFVLIEHRGAAVFTIITLSSVSSADQSVIKAGMSAHGGWGPLSGSASVSFQSELNRAAHSGRLSVQVVATGGSGFGALGDLIANSSTQASSLEAIQKALGAYLKDFNAGNAAPIGYQVASMELLGWDSTGLNLWNEYKERQLRTIVSLYRNEATTIDQINAIANSSDPRARLLDKTSIAALKKALPPLQSYLGALAQAHKQCKEDLTSAGDNCKIPTIPDVNIDALPSIPSAPASAFRVVANGELMDPILSRAIVDAEPRGELLVKVKVYRPDANAAHLVLKVDGNYLSAATLSARMESSITQIGVLPIQANGAQYPLQNSVFDNLGLLGAEGVLSTDGVQQYIHDKLQCPTTTSYNGARTCVTGPNETSVTFFIDLVDEFGRHFPVDIATFSFAKGWRYITGLQAL